MSTEEHTMNSINAIVAAEHRADLLRAASRQRPAASSGASNEPATARTVALRPAHADEAQLVNQLAELDDAPTLEGQVLLALIDGEAVAALSLRDGRVVANPFRRTQDAIALLRVRAKHLSRARSRRRLRPTLRPRLT
jgi:hypothetical protein